MKKGKVLNLRGCNKIFEFVRVNNLLIILTVCFIIGLCFGVLTLKKYDFLKSYAEGYISDFMLSRTGTGFFKITLDSFLSSMLFIFLSFSCGASLLGVVLVPLCVSVRGFLYGCVTALLYAEYSLKGIAFNAVLLLPPAIIFIIALILASLESVRFSLLLARITLPATVPTNLSYNFKNYCGRYLLFCILVLVSAVADALLSVNFLTRFSL